MLSYFLKKWLGWQWVNMSEVLGMLQQTLNQISTDNQLILGKVAVKCQWSVQDMSVENIDILWSRYHTTVNLYKFGF